MQVLLLERVSNLGQIGDLVNVRPGYARNFLFPKGYADRATAEKIEELNNKKKQLEARDLEKKAEAKKVADSMDDLVITMIVQASEAGNLYGSIKTKDIAKLVSEAGFSVNKEQILINSPIKTLGIHVIDVVLHAEISVNVKLNLALSATEAQIQLENNKNQQK